MSGFILLYQTDRSQASRGDFDRMMQELRHRGPDGCHVRFFPSVAIGHHHFWTTPEEVGETQPLSNTSNQSWVVLDGRIDNRKELIEDLHDPTLNAASDATLFLNAYARWGHGCFAKVLGPFAVVIYEAASHRVIAARDPLGDRTLFYSRNGAAMLIASEENALLKHPGVSKQLDEKRVAAYFALKSPAPDGSTFFKNVKELLPGSLLQLDGDQLQTQRFWTFRPHQFSSHSDHECGEQFKELLQKSVSACTRSIGKPAVLMSGGLDSTSVAALAAKNGPIQSISWIFDEIKSCDERRFIDLMAALPNIESQRFTADEEWPLRALETWPFSPNTPGNNVFRNLKERAYSKAHQTGSRTLLTGAFGDRLYSGWNYWLLDLLRQRFYLQALSDAWWHVRNKGLKKFVGHTWLRTSVLRRKIKPASAQQVPVWLTEEARELLPPSQPWPIRDSDPVYAARHNDILGLETAHDLSSEIWFASRHQIEVRDPYRSLPLIEFMLSLPADQLYRRGTYKIVQRNAMKGVLPEEVRTRTLITPLDGLFMKGVKHEARRWDSLLSDPDSEWTRFVDPRWVFQSSVAEKPQRDRLITWYCVSFDQWLSRYGYINTSTTRTNDHQRTSVF